MGEHVSSDDTGRIIFLLITILITSALMAPGGC